MSVIYLALPVALVMATIAVIAFVMQVRSGQLDDLETPPRRILFDDIEARRPRGPELANPDEDGCQADDDADCAVGDSDGG